MSGIKFRKVRDGSEARAEISHKLENYLAEGSVLLLLSGGSAVTLEADIIRSLPDKSRLTISLNDERYGPVGHQDSNWQQLLAAGLEADGGQTLPVLQGKGFDQTAMDFNHFLTAADGNFDCLITILGMGGDGHTSGILPRSPAVASDNYAGGYQAADYQRLTNTFRFLRQVDEAFVYAFGETKHGQIDKLDQEIALAEQPIQIIKQIPRVTFYNDYKGD